MSRIGGKDNNVGRPPSPGALKETQEGQGEGQTSTVTTGKPAAKKVTAADAERMASQAGFVRTGAKKKGQGFDVGDSSQAPIPLPEDDVDAEAWATEVLATAQRQLQRHNGRIGRGRNKKAGSGLQAMFAAIVEGDEEAGDEDADATAERLARLHGMGEQVPPNAAAMAALAASVRAQFGVDFAGAPPGAALLATSLLVAGHPEDVEVQGKELAADKLLGGLQRVVDEGRNAAEDARQRSEGVSRSLAMHRTFVPKR